VDAVSVLCESVSEIRRGLMSDCSVVESCHWDLKLAALCTWRTLASYAEHTGSDDVLHCIPACALFQSLPHWNFTFYFCVVIQSKWTKYLVEVVGLFLFMCVSFDMMLL